jgi:hypothetical protein
VDRKLLYPSRFESIDMGMETKNFYKKFFGYNISDEPQINTSGIGMRLEKVNGSNVNP